MYPLTLDLSLLMFFFGLPLPLLATGSPFSPSNFFSTLSDLTGVPCLPGLPRFLGSFTSFSLAYKK